MAFVSRGMDAVAIDDKDLMWSHNCSMVPSFFCGHREPEVSIMISAYRDHKDDKYFQSCY